MATSLSNYDLKIASDKAVQAPRKLLMDLNAFAFKAETRENVVIGDIVTVPVMGQISAATAFNASSNNYETDNGEAHAFKSVTLNKQFKSTFEFTPSEWARLSTEQIDAVWAAHTNALGNGILADIQTLVTATAFAETATDSTAANFDADDVVNLRKSVVSANGWANGMNLNLCLQPDWYGALLKDSSIKNVLNWGSDEAARAGEIRNLRGFQRVIESNIIPTNSEKLIGFATDSTGIAVAQTVILPGKEDPSLMFEIAVDPDTGFTVAYSLHMSLATRHIYGTVECWYGAAVANAKGLIRITNGT
jgi:hypothetical protein